MIQGARVVDLFEIPDTTILRPHDAWICLDTNNGHLWEWSLEVEVNMRDSQAALIFNQWQIMKASITEGHPGESVRYSGWVR